LFRPVCKAIAAVLLPCIKDGASIEVMPPLLLLSVTMNDEKAVKVIDQWCGEKWIA